MPLTACSPALPGPSGIVSPPFSESPLPPRSAFTAGIAAPSTANRHAVAIAVAFANLPLGSRASDCSKNASTERGHFAPVASARTARPR